MNLIRLAVVTLVALSGVAQAAQTLLWNSVPLTIRIPADRETVIRLPSPCEIGVPAALNGLVRIDSVESVLLIQPSERFTSHRFALRRLSDGRVYLIDIEATAKAPHEEYVLVDPRLPPTRVDVPNPELLDASTTEPMDPRVQLTRFAAREFYAPERLRGGLSVARVPVPITPVALYRGHSVRAVPRAAWSYQGLYVTAVELTNRTPDSRTLDPRLLRGDWLSATFQHGVLAPAGSDDALTMLYLVSQRPWSAQRVPAEVTQTQDAP